MSFVPILAGLLLLVLASAQQAAPQQQVFRHPLTDMPPGSSDVETSFYYPGHEDVKIPIGESVTVLCHFINDGLEPLNVTAIMGSLNNVFQFDHFIQNYSYKPYFVKVNPEEGIVYILPTFLFVQFFF